MKRTLRYLPFLLVLLIFIGCETDEPVETSDPRDKFLGAWNVSESCLRLNYEVEITYDSSNSSQVLIYNYANPGPGFDPVYALVVGNSIYVTQQEFGDNWSTSGEGVLKSDGSVDWEYELILSGVKKQCTASYQR